MKNQDFIAGPERALMLETEGLVRVHGPAWLRVMRGRLWLTVDGQSHDHMLDAGDEFMVGRGDRALAQAIFAPAYAVVADEAVPVRPQRGRQALRFAVHRLAQALA